MLVETFLVIISTMEAVSVGISWGSSMDLPLEYDELLLSVLLWQALVQLVTVNVRLVFLNIVHAGLE